jgi:hypothetical protein
MYVDANGLVVNDGADVYGGRGRGEVGELLADARWEPGLLRPFVNRHGRRVVALPGNKPRRDDRGKIITNAAGDPVMAKVEVPIVNLMRQGIFSPVFNVTSLRLRDWVQMDQAIVRATRQRLRAWADLSAASSVGGFDAMSKLTYEYEMMSDPGEAVVDMDALADARRDSPLFKLTSVPLPITHSDFWFSDRRLRVSANSSTPLGTTMAEAAGRRVAETVEKTLIGTEAGLTYGTQTAGYTTFPYRNVKTNVTIPTGANPEATVADILAMRQSLYADGFFGPFMVYHSTDWDLYLDNDYARLGGNNASMTLRERLRGIEGIQDVRRLDFLTSTFTLLMVQMTPEVAQAINGLDVTTVQWPSQGGARLNFKVMCIQVPLLRRDFNGNCGILHATTA